MLLYSEMNRILIFLLTFFASTALFSQDNGDGDSLITIRGTVIDTNTVVGFYNMMVVNKTAGKGIFGDYHGTFEIVVRKSDLVAVSVVGYQTVNLSFKNKPYQPVYEVTIYLKMLSYSSDEVIVTPYKTLEELQEERANIAKREVPTVTLENAFTSPITALYMAFSKREQTKRLVAEMEYADQQHDVIREILRLYVHHDIIDLSDEDLEEFIVFLNLNPEFLQTASDYDLIVYIKDKYAHFERIKEGY